jgi:hypothetical protein
MERRCEGKGKGTNPQRREFPGAYKDFFRGAWVLWCPGGNESKQTCPYVRLELGGSNPDKFLVYMQHNIPLNNII